MFRTNVVEEIEPHILYPVIFFDICALYDVMWNNILQRGRPRMTTWHMRIACLMPKATHTRTHTLSLSLYQYAIIIAFPLPQWLQDRASMLLQVYTYIAVLFPFLFIVIFTFCSTDI
jgi:hypothetical protein